MRKILGLILLGLSGFLVAAAVLLLVWAPGKAERTPLDINSTTRLEGKAKYLNEPETPVKAISRNKVNVQASNDDVVVFNSFTCLVRDKENKVENCVKDKRLISSDEDVFATDRNTGQAVPNYADLPKGAVPHHGLVNKFPFGVEKKGYQMWDGVLGRAVPVTFQGEEKVKGLDTYKFLASVKNQPAKVSGDIDGTYSSEKTMWIDPNTGSIIRQHEKQNRKLDDGKNAITLDFGFTDATVKANVDDAESNASKLGAIKKGPWVLLPLGLISGVAGFLLVRGASHSGGRHRDDEVEYQR